MFVRLKAKTGSDQAGRQAGMGQGGFLAVDVVWSGGGVVNRLVIWFRGVTGCGGVGSEVCCRVVWSTA